MKKVLLVDGANLMYRCYWAIRGLKTRDGFNTSAFYGFIKSLNSILHDFKFSRVVIVFDGGGVTWRHILAEKYIKKGVITISYKTKKYDDVYEELKRELFPQFFITEEFLKYSGIPLFKMKGVEGDDLIGNICYLLKKKYKITILSGDKDYYQLLDDNISLLVADNTARQRFNYRKYTKENFVKEYDIEPRQWIDVGALMGDNSDCITGIRGIGPKRAIQLVKQHGGIKGLLNNPKSLAGSTDLVKKVMDGILVVKLAYILKRIKKHGFVDKEIFNEKINECETFSFTNINKILGIYEIQDFNIGMFHYNLNRRGRDVKA